MARTRRHYASSGITLISRFGFENTFAVLVRRSDARRHGLSRISDLRGVAAAFQPGFGFEFVERQDGYRGLAATYDLAFSRPPRAMELSLMYRELADGDVDVVAGDATSALIDVLDLTMLEDDLRYFPPYDAVALARTSLLLRRPEVARALARLDGAITVEEMRGMNRAVDVDKKPVATVAREFLDGRSRNRVSGGR
jgi:osmoprotectant transport system permease protein